MTIKKWISYSLWVLGIYSCFSCTQHTTIAVADSVSTTKFNKYHTVSDSVIPLLHEGMIAVRLGNDITSEIFRKMSQNDASYSHIGIVSWDSIQGRYRIYHAIGGETNPDEALRYDDLDRFFDSDENLAFGLYSMDNQVNTQSLRHFCDSLYRMKMPFDMKFDLASNDRLYCAEFVYKAINYSRPHSQIAHSHLENLDYIAVDNITHAEFVSPVYYHAYQNINALKNR